MAAGYDWRTDFAIKLERAMVVRGFNAPTLAREIGVDKATIGRWLSGSKHPRNPELVLALDRVLAVQGFLTLPADLFFERNGLYESYRGMRYIRIRRNNADTPGEFEECLEACLANTYVSMHYTRLCEFDLQSDEQLSTADFCYVPPELRIPWFVEKFIGTEIIWEKAEIFFSLGQLVQGLRVLRLLDGTRYVAGFFPKPPRSFPTINLESFDHRRFMIGGYDPGRVFRPNCVSLGDREPLRDFLVNYWEAVWKISQPEPLTFHGSYRIAKEICDISEVEWDRIMQRVVEETTPLRVSTE